MFEHKTQLSSHQSYKKILLLQIIQKLVQNELVTGSALLALFED